MITLTEQASCIQQYGSIGYTVTPNMICAKYPGEAHCDVSIYKIFLSNIKQTKIFGTG